MKNNADLDELYLEAMRKWDNEGDPEAAFVMFSHLALQGDASSQNCLGIMYGEGEGVEKDDAKSLFWHKSAARLAKNSSYDYSNVARQYEIMGNRRRALYWLNKGHATGGKGASLRLAKMLLQKRRSDSRRRATKLLQIAAAAIEQLELSGDEIEEAQDLLDNLEKVTA